jgi:hypothetical protein
MQVSRVTPCGSRVYMHVLNKIYSHGCTREASASAKVKQSHEVKNFSTCPDTAVRQAGACGRRWNGTLEGGENGRCKEKELP